MTQSRIVSISRSLDKDKGDDPEKSSARAALISERQQRACESSEWQTSCIDMIRQLENFDQGREFVDAVWANLIEFSRKFNKFRGMGEDFGSREARALKSGILGMRLAEDVIRDVLGPEVIITASTSRQDVLGATDLIVQNGLNRCAIQVKTTIGRIGDIDCELIDRFSSVAGLGEEATRRVMSHNYILERVRKEGIADKFVWIEVIRPDNPDEADQVTGKATPVFLDRIRNGYQGLTLRETMQYYE
jgi:hypothetical protein